MTAQPDRILSFRAGTPQEAYEAAQRALGGKVRLLNTRVVGGKFFGLFNQQWEVLVQKGGAAPPAPAVASPPVAPAVAVPQPLPAAQPLPNKAGLLAQAQEFLTVHGTGKAGDAPPQAGAWARSEYAKAEGAADALLMKRLERQLERIERSLSGLSRESADRAVADLPDSVRRAHDDLLSAGVDRDTARDLVLKLGRRLTESELRRDGDVRRRLLEVVGESLPVRGPVRLGRGERRVVALVGPTGAGKTTTAAKLAGQFWLARRKVGVLSLDTFRIAATDQLRRQMDILQVPMEVASDAASVREGLDRLADAELVVIDTTGRSPRNARELRRQGSLLRAAKPDEVHLVVAANTHPDFAADTLKRFAVLEPSNLVLSKVDEAPALGGMLRSVLDARLGVSYLTVGQEVPDDLEGAVRDRLAQRLVGLPSLDERGAA